jgi:transcription antitermination factor NusG
MATTNWYALQVRGRNEKAIASLLSNQDYECFLPVYKCRRRWSDRIKEIELPLFPGYLFCRFDPHHRLPILVTPGVLSVVGVARKPMPVEEAEIRAIETVVSSGLPTQPWPFLHLGDRVRIDSGALRGLEGILLEFKGQYRIVVSVTLLQRSVAVEIDSAWVRSLGRESVRTRVPAGSWALSATRTA